MTAATCTNPVLNADWSDPDVVRVGDDFHLTASSFGRAPGLPLLHSRDLVNRTPVGLAERERDAAHPLLAPAGRARRIEIGAGARCRFAHDTGEGLRPSGPVFAAAPWRWVGALLGLFALAPSGPGHAGAASFTEFRIRPL
ncbi:family 43 glycosylhydrolase [Streptomyces sp. SS7]|uniref:family 43 glycosylhydrolase n=1 Tax=Streptomyces sp. SS7 TaxID=3108485 RepID=UPI0030EC45C6